MSTNETDNEEGGHPYKVSIGERLAALRERRGWSQEKLAELVERRQTTISNWEGGDITLDGIIAAAGALEVSVYRLLPDAPEGVSEGVGLTLRRLYQQMEEIAEEFDALESLRGEVSYRRATGNEGRGQGQQGGGSATSGGRNDDEAPDP